MEKGCLTGAMLLTLGTASKIGSESYQTLVNISQKDRKSLGSVGRHITRITVTGPGLTGAAGCLF